MDRQVILAEEYEKSIPLLLKGNSSGIIHSVFENGVNIMMGERLIFIGTVKNGRLPFGIHLQKEQLNELIIFGTPTSKVYWDEQAKLLFFENQKVAINLEHGNPYENIVNPFGSDIEFSESVPTFIKVLIKNGEPTGLELEIGQFMIDLLESHQPTCSITRQVQRLMEAVYSQDSMETEMILRYFLGRGKGLTPSGDDHLVGLLAIHQISNSFSPVFLKTLRQMVEREKLTTDIGREYLLYAMGGRFSSSVANLVNAITAGSSQSVEEHLSDLLTMGHSSGVDTGFGMLIGILSIMNWRK